MKSRMEHFPEKNPNPVLCVEKDGTLLYSNEAGNPLLIEWDVKVGDKLPSNIVDFVQRVISLNSPEKIEVKAGNCTFLLSLHHLPEEECVTIYGFDISDRKLAEEALLESEEKFRTLFNSIDEGLCLVEVIINDTGKPVDLMMLDYNSVFQQQTGFRFDTKGKNVRSVFTIYEEQWFYIIGEVALTGKSVRFENYVQSLNRWYSSFATRIGGEGSFRVAIVFNDITERKLAEEALLELKETLEEKVKARTSELDKAYNSLKESEERLAEAQKMAHIGNYDNNIVTNELYWSDELYRIIGLKPQEGMTYERFLTYVHPDDRDYVYNSTNEAFNGNAYAIIYRIIRPDGEERTIHSEREVVFDEKNNPVRLKGTLQDITEHDKTEEKIKILANVVESTLDAIGTLSLEGIVTSWNKGAEQIYGYSSDEIIGKHISLPAPSHLKNETNKYIELIKQTGMSYRYTTSRLSKDGEIIILSITLSPVIDNHGKLIAISFISRNITNQKKYEEKILESEEKYRNIVETANEGILITDDESTATYVNKKFADMLRYSPEELVGMSTWGLISEEYIPIVKLNLEKRRQGISNSYELKIICKDGNPVWTIINAKPLFDNDGRYIGAMSMFTDITKRKEAEESLRNFEIARKKEIHHRIKNNLQVISSLLDLQADLFKGREDIRDSEVLSAFKQSIDRVLSIALIHEELYKGSNIESLNFSQYIKELAENLILTYRLETDISFNFDLEEKVFLDMDTAVPLGIIINELITNSFKYAFTGRNKGEIQIKLYRDVGECKKEECKSITYVLSISDNGIGIPADLDIEDLDSLGLQLVTTLVDQLDGELELKIDDGTEFIIRYTVRNQASVPHSLFDVIN